MAILGSFWKRFTDLLPSTPRHVGTVVSLVSTGRYSIQLAGGGVVQATTAETYSVSDRVFVVDKKIEGRAPTLPSITIEV